MTTWHLIRHGQASFGEDNYDQLSALGERQCRLLGEWWRASQLPADEIVVGAMQRHRQSAAAFCEGYGTAPQLATTQWRLDAGLNEFDHEQVLHRAFPEFSRRDVLAEHLGASDNPRALFQSLFTQGLARWMGGRYDADYDESWPAFKARIGALLQRADNVATDDRRHVLMFTSGGPVSALCQHLLAIPDSHAMQLLAVLMNSSVTRMVRRNGRWQLLSMNGAAHLECKADRSLISYR